MLVRYKRRILWAMLAIVLLPVLWVLEIEITYEHNVRRGIPADFTVPHGSASACRVHVEGLIAQTRSNTIAIP